MADKTTISPEELNNEGEQGNEGGEAQRPAWLPEKFKTPEDMAKSYTELEKKLGGGETNPTGKEGQSEEGSQDQKPPADETVEQTLERMTEAYANQDNSLTEEQYAELAAKGYPKTVVDNYIAGQVAAQEALVRQVFDYGGGEQRYGEMVQWAATNLSEAEQQSYDAALASGDPNLVKMVVEGLSSRFAAATGNTGQPNQPTPGLKQPPTAKGAPGLGLQPFKSTAEMTKAMQDPRYSGKNPDPAYQKEVQDRLAISEI